MKPIRLKIRGLDGTIVKAMLIDDRGSGLDIREADAPFCDADRSHVVDLETLHCHACTASIADQIGLTVAEHAVIRRWRNRKDDGVSAKALGEILDKIVKRLDYVDPDCSDEEERFVIEIEETHG